MYPSERIDKIITLKTSEELGIELSIIEQVFNFQFKTANEATTSFNTIELTDLGTFKTPQNKLSRKIKTLNRKLEIKKNISLDSKLTERKRNAAILTCSSILKNIQYLESKKR